MWPAAIVVALLLVPLLLFRAYSAALVARSMREAPATAKSVLASLLRANLANVLQKVAILVFVVSLAARGDAERLNRSQQLLIALLVVTLVWTLAEFLLHRRAKGGLDEEGKAFLDSSKRTPAWPPWGHRSSV